MIDVESTRHDDAWTCALVVGLSTQGASTTLKLVMANCDVM